MNRALVIGYGNPLRGDDGFGLRVVERCQRDLPSITAIGVQQLTPELAEQVAGADIVIFVDACIGDQRGIVRCEELRLSTNTNEPLTHSLGPVALLTYACELFGSHPSAYLITVVGENFAMFEGLSRSVEAVVPTAIEIIHQRCQRG